MRLLPSQVVAVMAGDAFASIWSQSIEHYKPGNIGFMHYNGMTRLNALLEAIPDELVLGNADVVKKVVMGRAAVRGFVDACRGLGNNTPGLEGSIVFDLYHGLKALPDRTIPDTVGGLTFLADPDLAASIREDLASVETSLRDADWKAATVMAGSAAEALLLWKVQGLDQAQVAASGAKQNPKAPSDLLEWGLHHFTEVAGELHAIQPVTAKQLRIVKGFRNLIHPGRAQRLAERCDRGTARAASAAVEFLIRDFS